MSDIKKLFVGENGNSFEVFIGEDTGIDCVCIQGKYKDDDMFLHTNLHPDDAKAFAREINKIANQILKA
jgi:hypothetical protein